MIKAAETTAMPTNAKATGANQRGVAASCSQEVADIASKRQAKCRSFWLAFGEVRHFGVGRSLRQKKFLAGAQCWIHTHDATKPKTLRERNGIRPITQGLHELSCCTGLQRVYAWLWVSRGCRGCQV